jgi:sulfur carrier protein
MTVTVNGASRDLASGATVADLLTELGRDPQQAGTAVARNGEVVPRVRWDTTVLTPGDHVEVLSARQGG